jgi:peptide/nickel transport system substrate-binding protein
VGFDTQYFEKNPNYFKGDGTLPYLDEVVITGILDESAQQAAMLAHQGDWHWVRNFGQYHAYVNHDQIMTVIRLTRGHHSFWMNRRNPPFDNVRVRQAIVMGLDRNAAIQILQEGFGSPGFLMMPGSAWELEEAKGCEVPGWYAPEDMEAQRAEARAILEEEGFDFNKTYLFTVEADAQVQARSTFVQEQLRLLGIQTDFDLVETVAYRQQTTSGTWGDFVSRNDTMPADHPTLGMSHYFHSGSINNNHWVPAPMDEVQQKMDDLLAQSGSVLDPVERKAISDEAHLYAMQQYWKFPLYWEQEAVAFWPEIRGYFHHPGPSGPHIHWEQLWYDPAHRDDKGFRGQTTGVPGGI